MPPRGGAAAAHGARKFRNTASPGCNSPAASDASYGSGGSGGDDPILPGGKPRPPTEMEKFAVTMRQEQVRVAYQNGKVQIAIAMLISGNFLTNIVEKQIDPLGINYPDEWKALESMWNIIFIIELMWNAYGSFNFSFRHNKFLCSSWNLFDCLVVGVSVPSLLNIELPGPLTYLRMLRAFRVFRLFKRIKSLNKIISSLANAIPGIINAAIVQTLVMCIYAILAVDLFGGFANEGYYTNINGDNVTLITMRNMTYGDEYYGTFFKSLYTLFQVLTGESWSEAVARPVIFNSGTNPYVGGVFFVSYILICGIVLVNVAIAVLLEKMVDTDKPDEADGIILKDLPEKAQMILSPLDTDGDGVLTKKELQKAAELLVREERRKESGLEEDADRQAEQIANRLRMQMQGSVSFQKAVGGGGGGGAGGGGDGGASGGSGGGGGSGAAESDEIKGLMEKSVSQMEVMRQETAARESKVIAELDKAAQREEAMKNSISALSGMVEALTAAAARRKPRPPGSRGRGGRTPSVPPTNGESGAGGGAGGGDIGGRGGGATPEDRLQDGDRQATKEAPERILTQHL